MARGLPRVLRPVRTYARLELLIGLLAAVTPWILGTLAQLSFGGLSGGTAHGLRLLCCGAWVFLATVPVGATFPLPAIADAHALMESRQSRGKVVLRV